MKKSAILVVLLGLLISAPVSAQQSLDALIDREIAQLVSTYKMLHASPELSHYEAKTSAFLAAQLRELGFTVTEGVGKYAGGPWQGHGVVAVMKNGSGPIWTRCRLRKKPACPMPARSKQKTMPARKSA